MEIKHEKRFPKIPGAMPQEPYKTLVQRYLSYLFQDGASPLTVKAYGWHLYKLTLWLSNQGIVNVDDISMDVILKWGECLRSKYATQTHKLAVIATKSFFRFLRDTDCCGSNISDLVQKILTTPKTKTTPQRTLSKNEIKRIMDTFQDDNSYHGIRNSAIVVLLLDTGLRAAELCSVEMRNLNLANRRIHILGKGGQWEFVYYSRNCDEKLDQWISTRTEIKHLSCDKLFFSIGGSKPGSPLTPRGLRTILRDVGKAAGVDKTNPHAFRRSFATLRIKRGQSSRGVQRLGRWKNLANLERYTQALMADDDFAQREANVYSPLPND